MTTTAAAEDDDQQKAMNWRSINFKLMDLNLFDDLEEGTNKLSAQ